MTNTEVKRLTIAEPALLIRIPQLFAPDMAAHALYEATRGVWRLGHRRENVKLAFSVINGLVQEVYRINTWCQAGTTEYSTRSLASVQITGRWEFVGQLADPAVSDQYKGGSVAHYFAKGASNPTIYVNA